MKFSFKLDIELDDEGQKVVVNGVEQKGCDCESKPEAKAAAMQPKCGCRELAEESIPEESIPCSTDIWDPTGFCVFRVTNGNYSCELDRCKPGYHCEPPTAATEGTEDQPEGYLVCMACVPDE